MQTKNLNIMNWFGGLWKLVICFNSKYLDEKPKKKECSWSWRIFWSVHYYSTSYPPQPYPIIPVAKKQKLG